MQHITMSDLPEKVKLSASPLTHLPQTHGSPVSSDPASRPCVPRPRLAPNSPLHWATTLPCGFWLGSPHLAKLSLCWREDMSPASPLCHLCGGLIPLCPPLSHSLCLPFYSSHENIFTTTSRAAAALLLPVPTQ